MNMHYVRRGAGKPLLLLHGIGGSWRSWQTILDDLALARDVIAVDLPGFGATPPLAGPVTIAALADAVTAFLKAHDLTGTDAVGSSLGARLVLELARRGGVLGAVVSLDPGGFWEGWEKPVFYHSVALSVKLVKALQPVMPALTGSAVGRTALFAQFSHRPWKLAPHVALDEMRTFANSPSFDELLKDLVEGAQQQGAPKGSIPGPLVIGWGRQDYVCLPHQSARALAKFPDARLYWFEHCGHFPQWDQPAEAVRLILAATSGQSFRDADIAQRAPAPAADQKKVPTAAVVAGVAALVAGGAWLLLKKRR
ncbi:alpha/beta fold hydrolase [Hymenobacter sp. PAMC 26628]|uniref:alpha/beta fold hydrolase n=1 Tax=Hymenobacter sp. PAMC 26628 TaxID=1484118 RepID=UPI00076FFA8E|nr:alpha/beta fold hydrolase [Hymenobacter sp. PAMC 26628]AMJ64981.1 hydrolase [Hymenobacter sp. PAMC 26628]